MAMNMESQQLVGRRVLDSDGSSVGRIGQVYYDDRSNEAKWVTVRTGLFGNRESFVPLQGAHTVEDDVQVPYSKHEIKDAPHFDVGQRISPDEERRIYEHYNAPYPGVPEPRSSGEESRAQEGGTARQEASGAQAPGADTDEVSMTRYEERVSVGSERAESGRVHLRKHVETEEFEETVPVTHEEVRVEREPVEGAEPGGRIEAEDEEIVLHEEHPTVSKESVPVERVRARKEEVTEDRTVRGERRRERIELEGDEEPPA
ncbi:DUF2382 domain-containing protein [Streptomonospora sp. PA3]|uniref:PRC and DUF2382 domain-containing protein n=1 Tax=Streptomonospora sp. PA3 TaxID=2607326 RepID=UPI0012DC922C|nr:PRC and DUF2382 domain-containing protein [Streptomonospora sp. PA3]MUL42359.1 DUF2382 domain-containing protein [Streptomonospora sp. PA3]